MLCRRSTTTRSARSRSWARWRRSLMSSAADRQAPRKQRHTARRLYRRILAEFSDATVAELPVRNHVRERKRCSRCDRWPAVHRAYLHATQQVFLEAHEHAFAYFGGVFRLLPYGNLASAVRKTARLSAGEDGAVHGVPLALAVCRGCSARPARVMRKVALKAKVVTSGATTWFRCSVLPISMR